MAHGIKQGISVLLPNMCGKELEKEGAAWIEGKDTLPILSLSLKPNIPLAWLVVTHFEIFTMLGYIVLSESITGTRKTHPT